MNIIKFLIQRIVLLAVVVFGMVACSGSDPTPGGGSTGTLSGTAATGAAIANTQITIKGANGVTVTINTDANGKYTKDVSTLTAPYLLRVPDPLNANSYLFSVANASGTANIHPFTDLIVRNWYKVKGVDVETQFTGTLDATKLPTVDGINTIAAVIKSILGASFAEAGVDPASFNLFTTPFDANLLGFDQVLEEAKVVIAPTTGVVTVVAIDPMTGATSTLATTTLTALAPALPVADNTNPSDPGNPVLKNVTNSSIFMTWATSTDTSGGIAGYNIYRNGIFFDTSPFPAYLDEGLAPSTPYCYQIQAADLAGNPSAFVPVSTTGFCATTSAANVAADTTAPAAPTDLTATASVTPGQIGLNWVASIDTDTVGYDIYRGTVKVATTAGTSYNNTGLAANTSYSYTVIAKDAAGNPSVASNSASATTAAGIPSAPANVQAVAGNQQVTISWSPVPGAISYNLYRGTVSGVSKTTGVLFELQSSPVVQTALPSGTTYFFVVTAVNASGESISSAQVQATPAAPAASTTLTEIQAQLDVVNGLFATSLPAANDPVLGALFDASFLDDGMNKADLLIDITDPALNPNGNSLRLIAQALAAPKDVGAIANDATHQWFTIVGIDCTNCRVDFWLAIKDTVSGKWLLAGNQRKVAVFADASAFRSTFDGTEFMNSFVAFALQQTGAELLAIGISSVTVSGSGMVNAAGNAGSATLFDGTQTLFMFISECNTPAPTPVPSLVTTNCFNYANLAAGDYTFTVSGSLGGVSFTHTYVETLPGIPPATANLTAAMFPVITNVPPLASLVPGATVTANWTLPSGYTPQSSFVSAFNTLGFLFDVEGIPGVTGSSFTLPTVFASTGTATSSSLCVAAAAANGALFGTCSEGAAPTPPVNAIVGSWSNVTGGWGPPGTDLEFTFFANGDYIQAQSVADGSPFVQPGLEHGTYTWNSATGAFTAACPTVDTNLQAGFSTPNGVQCTAGTTVMSTTVTVIGNTMTIIDNSSVPPATITLSRVVDANNAIVGSWAFPGNTSVELTFFANGDYMQAQSVANNIPTIEQPGLEHGTYTWNSATGAFTAACPTVDTNLQAGFSHPAVTGVGCTAGTTVMSTTVTVNGNTMTLIDNSVSPPETITLSRVN